MQKTDFDQHCYAAYFESFFLVILALYTCIRSCISAEQVYGIQRHHLHPTKLEGSNMDEGPQFNEKLHKFISPLAS